MTGDMSRRAGDMSIMVWIKSSRGVDTMAVAARIRWDMIIEGLIAGSRRGVFRKA
jgi:hypothetical protein